MSSVDDVDQWEALTLEDTQSPKIGERNLELANSLGSRDKVFGVAGNTCFEVISTVNNMTQAGGIIIPFFLILAIAECDLVDVEEWLV